MRVVPGERLRLVWPGASDNLDFCAKHPAEADSAVATAAWER